MQALINGKVHTVSQGVLDGATILIDQGKILDVGIAVTIPQDAERIDLAGKYVFPGLIDAHCHVGIFEEGIQFEGDDGNEMTDPVTPYLRALDGINPGDQGFTDALTGGITTVFVVPGSANVIGGTGVVMKTAGKTIEKMVVRDPAGLKIAFGENPKRVYDSLKKTPSTRMGTAGLLRKALVAAQNYARKLEKGKTDPDKAPEQSLDMEVLVSVLRREIPLRAHAHRADDIMTAIRIAEEFTVDIVIEHCTEGHLIPDELARRGIPAVVGPSITNRAKVELREKNFGTASVLVGAGVKVALMTDHPVIPIELLPICAGFAIRGGLTEEAALRAITLDAAEILGVADRVGSIEVGKDADIVVATGSLTEIRHQVEMVWVNGERVYNR